MQRIDDADDQLIPVQLCTDQDRTAVIGGLDTVLDGVLEQGL